MDNSKLIFGILVIIFGILTFLYAEHLRRKEEMDSYNFRLYIYAVLGVLIGLLITFKYY